MDYRQTFDRVKKEFTDGTLRLAIPNSEKPFYILCEASNYGIEAALLHKKLIWKNGISFSNLSFVFHNRT